MPSLLNTLLTAYDGALVGASLAVAAYHSFVEYLAASDALRQIRDIPSVRIADLRSLLEGDDDEKLVIVRARVQVKRLPGLLGLLLPDNFGALRSRSGVPAVIIERSDPDWYGFRCLFEECWSSVRSVQFVLAEGSKRQKKMYLHVRLGTPFHTLPLTRDVHHVLPASYLWNIVMTRAGIFKEESKEESILRVGKEITAVGICRKRDGALEIKPCMQLPYFLSDMTKIELEAALTHQTKFLFWTGIVLGTMSVSILGYAVIRSWQRWKEEVHNTELCVICLKRRKTTSLCGHCVRCEYCAIMLRIGCPICQQAP